MRPSQPPQTHNTPNHTTPPPPPLYTFPHQVPVGPTRGTGGNQHQLATRIMSNGVGVIVASDKTTLPGDGNGVTQLQLPSSTGPDAVAPATTSVEAAPLSMRLPVAVDAAEPCTTTTFTYLQTTMTTTTTMVFEESTATTRKPPAYRIEYNSAHDSEIIEV